MEIETVSSEREAVDGCGIIVSAVNSAEPVILGDWLKPGMHVNSVGTARPTQREIDADVYRRANIIVVDTREGVFHEAGDAIAASEAGAVSPDAAFELHEIVGGTAPVREDDNQITLFKSIGTAVQDVSPRRPDLRECPRTRDRRRDRKNSPPSSRNTPTRSTSKHHIPAKNQIRR